MGAHHRRTDTGAATERPAFDEVAHGYDPRQVDDYLATLWRYASQVTSRAAAAESALKHERERSAGAAGAAEFAAQAGGRIGQMLAIAQREADEIIDGARQIAESALEEVIEDAGANHPIVREAREQAEKLLLDAVEESRRLALERRRELADEIARSSASLDTLRHQQGEIIGTVLRLRRILGSDEVDRVVTDLARAGATPPQAAGPAGPAPAGVGDFPTAGAGSPAGGTQDRFVPGASAPQAAGDAFPGGSEATPRRSWTGRRRRPSPSPAPHLPWTPRPSPGRPTAPAHRAPRPPPRTLPPSTVPVSTVPPSTVIASTVPASTVRAGRRPRVLKGRRGTRRAPSAPRAASTVVRSPPVPPARPSVLVRRPVGSWAAWAPLGSAGARRVGIGRARSPTPSRTRRVPRRGSRRPAPPESRFAGAPTRTSSTPRSSRNSPPPGRGGGLHAPPPWPGDTTWTTWLGGARGALESGGRYGRRAVSGCGWNHCPRRRR